jgi:HD-GYP domain-containing protein (c-di-GMP phosphodiesterase class II)
LLRPVHLDPALIGQPLPYDLFSESGVLIASAGMLLADETQFNKLTIRPLYQTTEADQEAFQTLDRLRELGTYTAARLAGPQASLSGEDLHLLGCAFLALFHTDPNACLGYPRLAPVAPPYLNHNLHVLFISAYLASFLEFSEAQTESLAAAALTMNIADIDLYDRLHNGYATNEDWLIRRALPANSANLLEKIGVTDRDWVDSVRQLHENLDGSGYPSQYSGAQISLSARILHVAEVYCRKIGGRYYRPPKSLGVAFKDLFGDERAHIDTQIATLLIRRIGLYPPGTLVRLANRENACITRLGRHGHIRFAVSFMDARGRPLDQPRERNLETRAYAIHNLIDADPAWPPINWPLLWGY